MTSSLVYHRITSYDRMKMKGHSLDWANRPSLHKVYPDLKVIQLPEFHRIPEKNLWRLNPKKGHHVSPTDFKGLSTLLDLTYLNTAKARHPDGDFYYRSAASAGALYPGEIYPVVYNVNGLAAGIYHYNLMLRHLTRICEGNFQDDVGDITAKLPHNDLSASFFITGIFFRSSWKYRERAFRYVLLDAGHILQNLVLALNANGLSYWVQYDFKDLALNHLLGTDDQREVGLASVHLSAASSQPDAGDADKFRLPSEQISMTGKTAMKESTYREIQDIYKAGVLESITTPRPSQIAQNIGVESSKWQALENTEPVENEIPYPEAVFLRRSKRNFVNRQLSITRFFRLLDLFRMGLPNIETKQDTCLSSVAVGFLANNIDGFEPGFYLYDHLNHRFGLVKNGQFGLPMTPICLEQNWLKNAAVHFLFMSDLKSIDDTWGARGYRYAMITAGRMGQLVYVGATALRIGCCGIGAIFDFEAQQLLGLNPNSFLTYLVAAGPVKH